MRRSVRAGSVVAVAAAVVVVGGGLVQAAVGHGYDVSWPQCGAELPVDGDVRIVGVSGGKPYEDNPCLRAQYQWASAGSGRTVAFYINTANPGPASQAVSWYGQKLPNGACSPSDEAACAFNYGFNAAHHAFDYATAQTGSAARWSWWLDVETANSWSPNVGLNIASLLGSLAFLRSQGVPVGAYSTGYQWGRIAGGAKWGDVPSWIAGANDEGQAASWCATSNSFTGGQVLLVQWEQSHLDHDHLCAPLPIASGPPPASSAPAPSGLELVVNDLLSLNVPKLLADLGLGPK